MRFFDISTIKDSIDGLEDVSSNWLIPAFVFAANGVGTSDFVDLSRAKGTDRFLDNYFNGSLIGIDPFPSSNNLIRPRMKGLKREFSADYVIRQDTKMWGNLFSSRGYREMRQRGEIEGSKVVRLTDTFQTAFESQIPASFRFEDFLVWLFAFRGFPNEVNSWRALYDHFVKDVLELDELGEPYRGRFSLSSDVPWPTTIAERPSDEEFRVQLAPQLIASLVEPSPPKSVETPMNADDPILSVVLNAIEKGTGRSFLLAGPPGTGKTHYAREIAEYLAEGDESRMLFLQFHPAFNYDDFVEGFRPAVDESSDKSTGVKYVLEDRHFLEFSERARRDQKNRLHVLVIDELNRGDVSRIFGEVLTYLELEYRDKIFALATSGRSMSFPMNLIVLATANPFDRSVTDLDDAFLRRFVVVSMEPDRQFLERYLSVRGVGHRVLSRTLRVFDLLMDAFPTGFGHTNFLKVRTIEDLAEVWLGRVQLGLQRALYHDRKRYDDVKFEIENLFRIDEEEEASGNDSDA